MMEFTRANFASVGFLMFATVGFSLMLPFSCDPSREFYVGGNKTGSYFDGGVSCYNCPGEIQTLCNLKGRTVSKFECNWWDGDLVSHRTTVCVGCCGAPHPPPIPVITDKCQAGDADLSFTTPALRPWDCGKCQNGCKDECEKRKETVSREMCVFNNYNYDCKCCCRTPPPPSPPPPSPSPPPPSPPPPPPPPSPPPPSPPPPPPSDPRDMCSPDYTSLSTVVTDCSLCPVCDCGAGVTPAITACFPNVNYCNCCCPTTLGS
ncbi:espin-like isoform X2 [Papaver somniferum]|uniref:espin-like isoform X2 n=1 Tax=Papaver somniferum TaxID=3469 RepID=UPI000E705B15|nr:espin-like isoform X2 [Papaver somniferum]